MEPLEFSDDLRRVLSEAREEALRLQHEHVGTEHLLIALLRERDGEGGGEAGTPGPSIVALDTMGVDRKKLLRVLGETVLRGRATTPSDQISYTSRAKAVLELAMAEARVLKHGAVSTEHLLLGLVREERGIAAQMLLDYGVTPDRLRAELTRLLG
jgi:ATP-dependent Clp protease ATP-binding subunit ClpC